MLYSKSHHSFSDPDDPLYINISLPFIIYSISSSGYATAEAHAHVPVPPDEPLFNDPSRLLSIYNFNVQILYVIIIKTFVRFGNVSEKE